MADQPMDLEVAVVRAWRYAAADMPGIRAILDSNLEQPRIAAARRKELALLAAAAGKSGPADRQAVSIGQRVEDRARGIAVETSFRGAA